MQVDDLPDDGIWSIFDKLWYSEQLLMRSVCKRFKHVVDECITSLRIAKRVTVTTCGAVVRLCSYLSRLRTVTIMYVLNEAEFRNLLLSCTGLTQLSAQLHQQSNLASILADMHCPRLEELRLTTSAYAFTDEVIVPIATACPSLVALALACNSITAQGVQLISQHLSLLCELRLISGRNLRFTTALRLPRLHTLSIRNCALLQASDASAICTGCPGITSLDVSMCESLNLKAHTFFAQCLPQLQSLTVQSALKSAEFIKFATALTRLDVSQNRLNAHFWQTLQPQMSQLRSLRISDLDRSVLSAAEDALKCCTKLESFAALNVGDTDASGMVQALAGCASLRELEIPFTAEQVQVVTKHLPHLQVLRWDRELHVPSKSGYFSDEPKIPRLTAVALGLVARACPVIRELGVRDMSIDDVVQAVLAMPNLDTLFIERQSGYAQRLRAIFPRLRVQETNYVQF